MLNGIPRRRVKTLEANQNVRVREYVNLIEISGPVFKVQAHREGNIVHLMSASRGKQLDFFS